MIKKTYRPEIDGLRAVAVLVVILFHLDIDLFRGGFIGVDIFFVISGYLITQLIKTQYDQNNFSIKTFYIRRINRLIPALLAMLYGSFIFATFIFSPEYMQRLGATIVASIFSYSNIYFWLESGYFDVSAFYKPLLHTWSLAVEEQFYFVWPTFLLLLFKLDKRFHLKVIFALGAISLLLTYLWIHTDLSATFYLSPFRVVEFAFGAALVWVKKPHSTINIRLEILFSLGLLLIIYSVLYFDRSMLFPGYMVAIPCLGASLCLYAGRAKYCSKLLNNRLMVYIGLISYSFYLIHWPIIAFYEYYYLVKPQLYEQIGIFILSGFLASLMYHSIELPCRVISDKDIKINIQRIKYYILAATLLVLASISVWQQSGWNWRFDQTKAISNIHVEKKKRYKNIRNSCFLDNYYNSEDCNQDKPSQVLIIGNSHEVDGYNIFNSAYGSDNEINFIQFGLTNMCLGLLDSNNEALIYSTKCSKRISLLNNQTFLESLSAIVYSSNRPFASNKAQSLKLLEKIKNRTPNIQLVIIGGYINNPIACSELNFRFGTINACKTSRWVSYFPDNKAFDNLRARFDEHDYFYVDKVAMLCENSLMVNCLVETQNNTPFSYDGNHLSLEFAEMTGRIMNQHYPQLIHLLKQ